MENVLEKLHATCTPELLKSLSSQLKEPEKSLHRALDASFSALLDGLSDQLKKDNSAVFNQLRHHRVDKGALGNLPRFFAAPVGRPVAPLNVAKRFESAVLGKQAEATTNALGKAAHIKEAAAARTMDVAALLAMDFFSLKIASDHFREASELLAYLGGGKKTDENTVPAAEAAAIVTASTTKKPLVVSRSYKTLPKPTFSKRTLPTALPTAAPQKEVPPQASKPIAKEGAKVRKAPKPMWVRWVVPAILLLGTGLMFMMGRNRNDRRGASSLTLQSAAMTAIPAAPGNETAQAGALASEGTAPIEVADAAETTTAASESTVAENTVAAPKGSVPVVPLEKPKTKKMVVSPTEESVVATKEHVGSVEFAPVPKPEEGTAIPAPVGHTETVEKAVSVTKNSSKKGQKPVYFSKATDYVGNAAMGTVDLGNMATKTLPNGTAINVHEFGGESRVVSFLEDPYANIDRKLWFTLEEVTFSNGGTGLDAQAKAQLRNIAEILRAFPNAQLKIGGYTSDDGTPKENYALSQKRADAAMGYIVGLGIDASRLKARGYGARYKLAENTNEAGRRLNRRIDVSVTSK
jgi:outer membrane protein OmpA-like peptidoglycan-associated protein